MLIEANRLCCRSGKRNLLRDIDWQVQEGQHWLIFGMNGSGKTTLLSTIAGMKPITSGSLRLFGKAYTRETIFALRRQVGLVSSSLFDRIYKNESALQIVLSGLFGTFGLGPGIRSADVRQAKALLRAQHLGDKIYQPFATMSKGERQRVLIARALMTKPKILALDEPCSGLDLCAQADLSQTVQALAKGGKVTILYVTHHPDEIPSFATKTMLLRHGQVFAQGNTQDMLTQARLSAMLGQTVQVAQNTQGKFKISVGGSASQLSYSERSRQQ